MLVSTQWLAAHLDDPDLVVVDLRWGSDGSGRARYDAGHIPGAVFLDWTTDIVDPQSPIAFMLAGPGRFASAMERCGIGDDTNVIAYADDHGSGAYRVWWACRVYGHENVRVLDGALEKWKAEGRPLSAAAPSSRPRARWTPRPVPGLRVQAEDVVAAASDPAVIVLDSRPADQYRGEAVWFETGPVPAGPDGIARTPRGHLRAGHVPWASSVPAAMLYRPDFTMKGPGELRELFAAAGVTDECRAITYCGVGISASALLFALTVAGIEDAALYDASWEEWGRDPSRPVARDA
jgi:thiosulfate/3-mercaptopyruvate sulfurtransferase